MEGGRGVPGAGVSVAGRIALLADLHVGRGPHPDGGSLDDAPLIAALRRLAASVELVILAGDVFDLQHGALPFAYAHELAVVRRRRAGLVATLTGPRFVRLVGNHDRALARLAGHLEDLRLDVGGRRLLVLHGHQVDPLHRFVPRLEALASWAAVTAVRAGFRDAWRLAASTAGRVSGLHGVDAADSPYARRLAAWGRARGATWVAHGHEHGPLRVELDGVTLLRPGASLGGHLRYALVDLATGASSLHDERYA